MVSDEGKSIESQLTPQKKYDKNNTKSYSLKLNRKTDADIIKWLDEKESVQGSIKELIKKEIKKSRGSYDCGYIEGVSIGNNIRCLREYFGESRETIAEVISEETEDGSIIAVTTIERYEKNCVDKPNVKILQKIAEHFGITLDQLIYSDFSCLSPLTRITKIPMKNKDGLITFFDNAIPIANFENDRESKFFKAAVTYHQMFMDCGEVIYAESAIRLYEMIYNGNNEAKEEAAVNFWGIMIVMATILHSKKTLNKRTAINEWVKYNVSDSNTLSYDSLEYLFNENRDYLVRCKLTAKYSQRWCKLADYYLSIEYVFDLVNNNSTSAENTNVGIAMMNMFAEIDNIYAKNFLQIMQQLFI